jgi:hypothetical protein
MRDDLKPGDQVTWHRRIPQGYGDGGDVPAVVVAVGRLRVTIDAALRSGGWKRTSVAPDNLTPRTESKP